MRAQSTTTGLPDTQFTALVARACAYDAQRTPDAHPRRPPSVPVEVAVHIVLLATRQNLVQALLGAIFGLSQPTVSRVLAWGCEMVLEVVEPEMVTLDDVGAAERVLVDGALVPTGDRAGHDGLYSGKRHTSGVGVQVVGDRWGRLLEVVGPVSGSVHDARAWFDLGLHERLAGRLVLTDCGYLGCGDASVGCVVWTPTRKPPNQELSWAQKVANYAHNSVRAAVERVIAHLKQWKVLSGGYRGPLSRVGNVIRAVVALEKLRTHPWPL